MNKLLMTLALALSPALGCAPDPTGVEPLSPPAAGEGFQLKTVPFDLPPGSENQDCYFFRVPSAEAKYVSRIVMRQTTGTHHMNIFRVRTQLELKGEDGVVVRGGSDTTNPCWRSANWADWPLLVNTQSSQPGKTETVFALPDGVAQGLQGGELLMLQSHYVNATTQTTPDQAAVWVNFEYIAKDKVQAELGTLFATNQNIEICPGQTKSFEKTCRVPKAVTIVGANGHFHSRGTRFQMNAWDEQSGKGAMFYDNTSWDDPLMATGLSVKLPEKAGVVYRCEFNVPATSCGDPKNNCCFKFGPKVETSEHCNAFVYYYPKLDTDIPCF